MNRSKIRFVAAVVAVTLLSLCALHSQTGTVCTSIIYAHIMGLGDTFTPTTNSSTNSPTGYLSDAGKKYQFIYKGLPQPAWVLSPFFDGTAWNGYPAIGLEVDPTGTPLPANDDGTDKSNLTIGQIPFPRDGYFGFSMKLGNFGDPNQEILVAQWWQGVPYSPPLSLHVIPQSNFQCEMQVRNNNTGGNPNAPVVHIPVGTCTPGQWQQFIIYARPHVVGTLGTGEVTVWHNNMTTPVADWTGDLGYDPTVPVNINGTPGDPQSPDLPETAWSMYVGPYGSHDTIYRQTYWANIALASTREGANPNQ